MSLPDDVLRTLGADPGIDRVELTGSRASGRARPQSDWDFQIATEAFPEVRERMPALVTPLQPVVAQWDRLSRTWCFMLLLAGPVKVDLIFDQPHVALPPWRVTAATLPGIDDHFWDWMLWLSGKRAASRRPVIAGGPRDARSACRLSAAPNVGWPTGCPTAGACTGWTDGGSCSE